LAFRVAAPAEDGWRFGPLPPSIEVVRGVEERCGTIPARPWPESVRAAAVVPVPRSGQDDALDALLVVGLGPRRAPTKQSDGAPRCWRSSIAPRPRFFPT
jgi:hypothetical protein